MKVLIIGSFRHDREAEPAFTAACQQIGAALARAGADLVVGSMVENTADYWVLKGAESVKGARKVLMFRPETGPPVAWTPDPGAQGRLEISYQRLTGPWAGGRVSQILAADAVLLIGGAGGTAQVGQSAIALQKPVLAVASFKGAALDIWPQLQPFYDRLGRNKGRIGSLREGWAPESPMIICEALKALIGGRIFRRTNLISDITPFVLTLSLFAGWTWLFTAAPQPWPVALLSLLALSAFLGTALRRSMRAIVEPAAIASRREVMAELCAGLILAFGLGLLYLSGSLTFAGTANSIVKPEDFQRIAVVMGLLGLAGGWLIERIADTLLRWLTRQTEPAAAP